MHLKRNPAPRLFRPASLFLPAALGVAALLGRSTPALALFAALYAARLCALATAQALPAAFALQPSIRYVQGSALIALLVQPAGAGIAALLLNQLPETRLLVPLVPCGLLLNIEHVFYEYLYAVGDRQSATAARGVTAVSTLVGLLLCSPPAPTTAEPVAMEYIWLWLTAGLSALVGLIVSLAMGGKCRPALNAAVLRRAPAAMVQAGLYPALAILALAWLWPQGFHPAPLFAGLALVEACHTPFRRSSLESRPMNRLLLIVAAAALAMGGGSRLIPDQSIADAAAMTCVALFIGALCAFTLYGSLPRREKDPE